MYCNYIKRILDIICSLLSIIICFPIFIMISILVRIKLGKPILFKQLRVSKNDKIFTIYKFRTMTEERDKSGVLLPNEKRLTRFGSFLRSTSLDELLELINILKGDISIIGPRPLIKEYLPIYSEYELQRHKVRGGLIPPEVLYGNIIPTWEQQFEYEVHYANNVSFLLDIKIIVKTLKGVFKRTSIDYGNYIRGSLLDERKNKMKADDAAKEEYAKQEEYTIQEEYTNMKDNVKDIDNAKEEE